MSTTGVGIGYGAQIRIGRGATPTWTTLAGVGDFDMPAGEADEVDVTSHSSPNRTMEYVAGMLDNGTMQIPLDYVPDNAQDVLLIDLHRSGEAIQIEITPPGATAFTYAGFVRSYQRSLPVKGKAAATLNLRISGEIITGP